MTVLEGSKEKLFENYVIITVFSYYDYLVFYQKEVELTKKGKTYKKMSLQEHTFSDSAIHFETLENNLLEPDAILDKIKSKIKEKTMVDAVIVTIYQMIMDKEKYDGFFKILPNFSERDLNLRIFKENLLADGAVIVKGTFPVIFEENINKDGLYN